MRKFKSRKTGEIIEGTFRESTKTHAEGGWYWTFIFSDRKTRWLFTSIEEFVSKYQEEPNKIMRQIELRMAQIAKEFKRKEKDAN